MVNDDATIVRLIAELGLSDDFTKVPPSPEPGGREIAVIYRDHVTHWMCFIQYVGTKADGYSLFGQPKSRTTEKAFMDSLQQSGVGGEADFEGILKNPKHEN